MFPRVIYGTCSELARLWCFVVFRFTNPETERVGHKGQVEGRDHRLEYYALLAPRPQFRDGAGSDEVGAPGFF